MIPTPLAAALDDPLVLDAVLFEGGAFAEFLQNAGRCCPTTSGCWPSNGCWWTGRCSRSSRCTAARPSPCATCAPATRTRCVSGRPAAS